MDARTPGERTETVYRTATGQRRHLRPCPNIIGVEVIQATAGDLQICDWSMAELQGTGRTYYATLDDALRAFGAPVESLSAIRDEVKRVEHDAIWIPYSRSYVAVGSGGPAVCWIGKTYVQHVGGDFIELPGYAPGGGGGVELAQREGAVGPSCRETMPLTGLCDRCD